MWIDDGCSGRFSKHQAGVGGIDPAYTGLSCAPSGARTPDPLIKSQLLYQLS